MDAPDLLALLGGLSLFLFGMSLMGSALEQCAGNRLRGQLVRLTNGKLRGFLTGVGVTAAIQSSSATTVMVVGLVHAGAMTLRQAIHVIMGANVGTTLTAWLSSLGAIRADALWLRLLRPEALAGMAAFSGVLLLFAARRPEKKEIGRMLLGFANLMYGMQAMTAAVSGLQDAAQFGRIVLMCENPITGVLAGTLMAAVLQSSSACVAMLQALCITGQLTPVIVWPIVMGQNIGTCITAMLAGIGTDSHAKRAALAHLLVNAVGTAVCLPLPMLFGDEFLHRSMDAVGVAALHTVFNLLCTVLLLPASGLLERACMALIKEKTGSGRKMPAAGQI